MNLCFAEFLDNCTNYYGPHSVDCLITIWESLGCLSLGSAYPPKLLQADFDDLSTKNLRLVLSYFCIPQVDFICLMANTPILCNLLSLTCCSFSYTDYLISTWFIFFVSCIICLTPLSLLWLNNYCFREVADFINATHSYPANNWDELAQVTCYGKSVL